MHYFPFKPADKIVASWTAIERVDEKNGCLYVVPGSHKGPLYQHTYPDVKKTNIQSTASACSVLVTGIQKKPLSWSSRIRSHEKGTGGYGQR